MNMKAINKITVFSLLSLIILSCNNKTKEDIGSFSNSIVNIDTILICNLEENIDIIQNIDDAAFLNDSLFFIISNKQLIKYSINGKQIQIFNYTGSAPYEYINPALINTNDSSIFIWCSTSLKLIEYDKNGKSKNVITNYKEAIKNFKVYKDKYVFFYKNNGIKQGIIDVYDIKKDQFIKSIGEFSEEDLVLSMLRFKPEIIIRDNYVYFVKPSSLEVLRFNLDNFDLERYITINDKEFIVKQVEDANYLINSQRMKAFDYIYNNSITDNIFLVNEGLIIKSEVGIYKPNEIEKRLERDKRYNKLFFRPFPEKEDKNSTWKTDLKPNLYNYINFNNEIYIIENTLNNEVEKSKLYKIQLKYEN